jgi:hypothetical protein
LSALANPNPKYSAEASAKHALVKARAALEGGFAMGEVQQSPSLHRAFPQFDDLWPAMQDWAQRMYGPMAKATTVLSPTVGGSSSDTAEEQAT